MDDELAPLLPQADPSVRDAANALAHDPASCMAESSEGACGRAALPCAFDITYCAHLQKVLLESHDERYRLSELVVSIQEEERRRIALDLHDGLGQSISLVKLAIENANALIAAGRTADAEESLGRIVPRLTDMLGEVRRVSAALRPSILDDLGIVPTISWFIREFQAVCHQIAVEASVDVREPEVPAQIKITLYRILQEATSNIIKHAAADRVRICLNRAGDVLSLRIEDNGRGFDARQVLGGATRERRGLGLVSMKERASLTGGFYCIQSAPGEGTRILASWRCS